MEHERERAERKAQRHEQELREASRQAEIEQQHRAYERDHKLRIADGEGLAADAHYYEALDGENIWSTNGTISSYDEEYENLEDVKEPISLMKHGKQRHEDIIKKRQLREKKKTKKRKSKR